MSEIRPQSSDFDFLGDKKMEENEIMEEMRMVNVYFVVEQRREDDPFGVIQIQRGCKIVNNLRSNIPMIFPFGEQKCLALHHRGWWTDDKIIRIPNGAIGKTSDSIKD